MQSAERLQRVNENLQGLIEDGNIKGKLLEDAFDEVLVSYGKLVTLILVPREKRDTEP